MQATSLMGSFDNILLFASRQVLIMKAMFDIAEKEGIEVYWFDFEPPVQGLYWAPSSSAPVIGLDNKLENNMPLCRCIIAEELGHHFTLGQNCLQCTYFNYRDRLATSKAEYRALKWAANYLMPEDKLREAFRAGCREVWQLADYFNVTEEMVRFRIKLLNCCQCRSR